MTTLNNVNIGDCALIKSIKTTDALKQRLYDIGMTPETVVKVLHQSPSGNPRAYLVRGSVIAIRNVDAEKIIAEVVSDG